MAAAVFVAPPVLWCADHLRPLVSECIPVVETLDLESLKSAAKEVSSEALALVSAKGGWNPVARTALERSLPECLAKWLNAAGVSAEHKEEITLAGAVVAIAYGSYALRRELRLMAVEKRALEASKAKENKNATQPSSN